MIGILPGMYEYSVTNRATSDMITDQMNIEFEGTLLHICSGYSVVTGNQNLVLKVIIVAEQAKRVEPHKRVMLLEIKLFRIWSYIHHILRTSIHVRAQMVLS